MKIVSSDGNWAKVASRQAGWLLGLSLVLAGVTCAAVMEHNARVRVHKMLSAVTAERDGAVKDVVELQRQLKICRAEVTSCRAKPPTPAVVKVEAGAPGTIAARLNNPLNIKRLSGGRKWRGEIGHDKEGHVHFSRMEYGIRAAAFVLKSYSKKHKIQTVEALVQRFCNGNPEYVRFLCRRLKVKPDEKFSLIQRMPELLAAMSKFESGKELHPSYLVTLDLAREL